MSKQSDPVWLEVALNGGAGRQLQPNIPIEVNEIIEQAIACVEAGAGVVHLHAYDGESPSEDSDVYAAIFNGIKKYCDPILYPTLGLSGDVAERLAPLKTLIEAELIEWMVVDPGSVNISLEMQIKAGQPGIVYANPDELIAAAMQLAKQKQLRPAYAIYEPGFARLGAAFQCAYDCEQQPVYRLMFSDNLLFGMPPSDYALEFYAKHLQAQAPNAPWMISGLDADISAIAPAALKKGAHLRVGLEDAPFGTDKTNVQLVEEAVAMIRDSGRELATADHIRSVL